MKDHVLNKKCFWSQGAFLFLHVYRCFRIILSIGVKAYSASSGVYGQHTGYMSDGFTFLNMMAFACLPFIFPHTKVWHILSLLFFYHLLLAWCSIFICPISMHMPAFLGYSMGYIPQLLWFTCNTVKKGILHFWS